MLDAKVRLWGSRIFCFQAEDGIRDLVRSRGLGDVYKRQAHHRNAGGPSGPRGAASAAFARADLRAVRNRRTSCLLYTSDAADERSSVDLGGRRIIKKKKSPDTGGGRPPTSIQKR